MVEVETSAQRRDGLLFAELYPDLRRFAAVVGPIEVDPDDLLQEALVRVLARSKLCDLDYPAAYLRRAIVNLASNHRRHLGIVRKGWSRIVASEPLVSEDRYPSDIADLQSLKPAERAVLYLFAVEGYRYAEIAEMLRCTEAAARKRAMRGRRRLLAAVAGEVSHG